MFFKKKDTPPPTPVVVEDINAIDYKTLYRQTKTELEKTKKQIAQQKNDEKEENRQLSALKKELDEKKEALFRSEQQVLAEKERVSLAEQSWESEKRAHASTAKKLEFLRKEKEHLGSVVKTNIPKTHKINRTLKTTGQQLESYKNLSKKHQAKIKQQEQTIVSLETKMQKMVLLLDGFTKANPSFVLKKLSEQLSLKTLHDFSLLESLYQRYQYIQGYADVSSAEEGRMPNEALAYGYIVQNPVSGESKRMFMTTDSICYTLSAASQKKAKIGAPVAAYIHHNQETASIAYVFPSSEKMLEEQKQPFTLARKEKSEKNKSKNYASVGDISVLIVGNKNGQLYKSTLSNLGAKAEWIDPFEQNPKRVVEKASSFDTVLLLEDCMPHASRQLLDVYRKHDPDKVQEMKKHDVQAIVARVRYLSVKKGFIKPVLLSESSL